MAVPEHIVKEMKRIMVITTFQTVGVAIAIVILALMVTKMFNLNPEASPLTIVVLVIGATMAVIGNSFVMNAATRLDAKETILWQWGNKVQAIGFMLTLIAAFL